MIYGGLVSVTFRKLQPKEVIELLQKAELNAVEWGGDIHVPHGQLEIAKKVKKMSVSAGITIAAYGSYYKAGISEEEGLKFQDVLNTAKELNAPTIRVWAGNLGSGKSTSANREKVVNNLKRISELSSAAKISISLEHHQDTLTDTNESCYKLLNELDDSPVLFYWQPPLGQSTYNNIQGLNSLLERLTNVHVYCWDYKDGKIDQRSLSEGKHEWLKYFHLIKNTGKDHYALLEFVKDNSPEQFLKDAETLKMLLKDIR